MASLPGSIAFDEFGRPFIIIRDQDKQKRLTGIDALKVTKKLGYVYKLFALAAIIFEIRVDCVFFMFERVVWGVNYVCSRIFWLRGRWRTPSGRRWGPRVWTRWWCHLTVRIVFFVVWLFRLCFVCAGEVTITNDGATILKMMDVDHEIAKLLVQLSQSQDNEIGECFSCFKKLLFWNLVI